MKTLKDSSEFTEAAKLFDELMAQSAIVAPPPPKRPKQRPGKRTPAYGKPKVPTREAAPAPELDADDSDLVYRGDRLENSLFAMCKRGGFRGSVLVDSNGFPLAVYNSPVDEETISAITTILGTALGKAGILLKQSDANNISMDIDYVDKAVIRKFTINDLPYFLMIICPQEVDERAEVELSIESIISILKKE